MKIKLTVTLPDGTKATRTTDHDYTHVVAVRGVTARNFASQNPRPEHEIWQALSWHGSQLLAVRRATSETIFYKELQVVKVDPAPALAARLAKLDRILAQDSV